MSTQPTLISDKDLVAMYKQWYVDHHGVAVPSNLGKALRCDAPMQSIQATYEKKNIDG